MSKRSTADFSLKAKGLTFLKIKLLLLLLLRKHRLIAFTFLNCKEIRDQSR